MAEQKKGEARYAPPTSQVDLEERLANDNASNKVLTTSDVYAARVSREDDPGRFVSDEAYAGVDPIYQTHANDTEKPLRAEEGPEAELEERLLGERDEEERNEEPRKAPEDPPKSTGTQAGEKATGTAPSSTSKTAEK